MLALIIIIAVVVVLGLVFVAMYNGLIRQRNNVDNSWSQIDVQLKRRHDLIPNLVETVKGYAEHERATFEAVINARNSAIAAQGGGAGAAGGAAQAENVLSGALRQLFALSEAYPDLKANQNFRDLQEELTATEDKIGYARQYYNDAVLRYNNKIQTVPTNVIAGMFNFAPREFFELEDLGERGTPRVEF